MDDQPPESAGDGVSGTPPSSRSPEAPAATPDRKPAAEAILGRMTDAFFAVDDNWYLTYVNEQARPILAAATGNEFAQGELVGKHLWEAIPEAVDTTFYEQYHHAMATQESVQFEEYFEPVETWFDVRAYPSETGISVYFQDVTERREREQLVAMRERVLRTVHDITAATDLPFEEKVDALLQLGCDVLDTDFGTLSQVSGDRYHFEYVRAPDGEVAPGDEAPLESTNCERAVSTRERLVLADIERDAPDLVDRTGNQDLGLACYLGTPVVVEEEVEGTFCFYDREPREAFTDWEVAFVEVLAQWIGAERSRQRTRERLERQNEQLEEFASIVSHDLRNPLTVLDSSLQLARETGEAEHFDRGQRAIDRMDALVDDLLTLARAGDDLGDRSRIDLESHVPEVWRVVSTADASLSVETAAVVHADETRLHQLFENLFRNAVDHAGDDVTVAVGDHDDGFYVADDGPGIPPDERDLVRDAGFTTADGTGYGLHIVENIVAAHGWSLEITESEAGGARFEVGDVQR